MGLSGKLSLRQHKHSTFLSSRLAYLRLVASSSLPVGSLRYLVTRWASPVCTCLCASARREHEEDVSPCEMHVYFVHPGGDDIGSVAAAT